jgi:hypothetical protein
MIHYERPRLVLAFFAAIKPRLAIRTSKGNGVFHVFYG